MNIVSISINFNSKKNILYLYNMSNYSNYSISEYSIYNISEYSIYNIIITSLLFSILYIL